MSSRRRTFAAATLVIMMLSLGCGVAPTVTTPSTPTIAPGGTLRAVIPADQGPFGLFTEPEGNPAALDPHLDLGSPYDTWELLRCCLGRTLMSTNGRATADGGARVYPDLAASSPEISADGLTWTFRLKQGVHYAPPLQHVEITAADFVRSFHRFIDERFGEKGGYGRSLFSDIVGVSAYGSGDAASITGLETPDRHTLVIRLTKSAGDFGPRLALPLVVPIPPSPTDAAAPFGVAEGHDDGYGRFLVSSGPYMIEGSADLEFSKPPGEQTPVAGLVPGQRVTLVRNPSWDPATDELRAAAPDSIVLEIVPTLDGAVQEIYSRQADLLLAGGPERLPPDVVEAVRVDPSLGSVHIDESDFVTGVMMNLAEPPFDDLFVRKAAAFALNKAELIEIVGGPLSLRVAHHMVPDAMEDNLLVDYRPYPSAGDAGDLAAAREMMKQSRYETDGEGNCVAPECAGIAALARDLGRLPQVAQAVSDDLAQIGIRLDVEVVPQNDFFEAFSDPSQHYAMYVPLAWAKDSLSPASFFVGQFYSPIALSETGNGSLVGATPDQLEQWGYEVDSVPTIDAQIEACLPLTGNAQFECWAGLDQHLMENVLPSISFGSGVGIALASQRVLDYEWDQSVAAPSFDRIVLAP